MTESVASLVIGCGTFGQRYGDAMLNCMAIELKACVDVDGDAAREFGEKFGCEPFISIGRALNVIDPSVIVICSSTASHFAIAAEILRRRDFPRLILCEKPVCETFHQLRVLNSLLLGSSSVLVVNHSRRFCHNHLWLKSEIGNGIFGAPSRVICSYYGGWLNNGVHLIDTLRLLFDDELKVDIGSVRRSQRRLKDDDIEARFFFEKWACPIDIHAHDSRNFQIFEIDMFFDEGRICLTNFGNKCVFSPVFVNSSGEKLLGPGRVLFESSDETSRYLTSALEKVAVVATNLEQMPENLSGLEWGSVVKTMETLFEVEELAHTNGDTL